MTKVILLLLCFLHVVLSSQDCGTRPLSGHRRVKRLVSGSEAVPHSWRWQVLIEAKGKGPHGGFGQHCGGTLISRQWVVTAAHCLFGKPDPLLYRVILGAHDWSKNESTTQTFGIEKMIVNRRFLTDKAYGYDIGLIKLSRPAVLNFAVGLACLPTQGDRIPVDTKCYITGWGRLSYSNPAKSKTLQQAALPTVSWQTCQAGNSWFQPVDDFSMVCAGYGGNAKVSGCNGDSGGPFVCLEKGKWVVRGAVSWGDPKCRAGSTYSVFVRISSFTDWIKMHMDVKHAPGLAQPDLRNLCVDKHYYCSRWKTEGKCQHGYFKAMLKSYCPLSCGYCTIDISARSTDASTGDSIMSDVPAQ